MEVTLSPRLDDIARDNTNDGDGWDVRLHHFTGLEEHGYPALYKNFASEAIAPLADYGGGSGTGGAWLDAPGIPAQWNGAPITVDWGRERAYRHALTRMNFHLHHVINELTGLPGLAIVDALLAGETRPAKARRVARPPD